MTTKHNLQVAQLGVGGPGFLAPRGGPVLDAFPKRGLMSVVFDILLIVGNFGGLLALAVMLINALS
jgi:hypothetical protein